jgi:hypothetical protein
MRKLLLSAVWVIAISVCPSLAAAHSNGSSSLTPEQVQVYADFIDSFTQTGFRVLLNRTFPLSLTVVAKDAECLQGIHLETVGKSGEGGHLLGPEVLRNHSIRIIGEQDESPVLKRQEKGAATVSTNSGGNGSGTLTDPGILALSGILFDTSHHFAVIKYVFLCGTHCNSGGILVLEKFENRWSVKGRPCDGSVFINATNPLSMGRPTP